MHNASTFSPLLDLLNTQARSRLQAMPFSANYLYHFLAIWLSLVLVSVGANAEPIPLAKLAEINSLQPTGSNAPPSDTTPLTITIVNPATTDPDDPATYYEKLLKLALEKTRTSHGSFVIKHKPNADGVGRVRAMLVANNGFDVIWSSVTAEREAAMRVVPFNLLRGLNDYRILLVHQTRQDNFNVVKNLSDLRQFSAGSGQHWHDTHVLRANNINVTTSIAYEALFKMLAADRFDFIACGMHEIDFAVKTFGPLGLSIEPTLLLHYKTPTNYSFFVNKDNQKLADRILLGLQLAQQDGSFEQVFNEFSHFKQRYSEINNTNRVNIEIVNPNDR